MMVRTPCPDHGELALELARGELEPSEAVAAEETVAGCATCAAALGELWDPEVAAGVEEGLGLARRGSSRRRWLPAAAAAAVLVVAGTVALIPKGADSRRAAAPELLQGVFQASSPATSDLNQDGRVDAADLALALQRGGSPTPRG